MLAAHRWLWIALGFLAACQRPDVRTAQPARTPYGTYELRLCRVTCAPEWPRNTIRSGWVVLDSAPIALSTFPDSVSDLLEYSFAFMADRSEDGANGCFLLSVDRPDVHTYGGLGTAGLTRWELVRGDDSIRFSLYRSPDAGHEVTVALTTGGFEGRGRSWGAGVAEVDYPDDIILARRLGPPEPRRCREAGLARLAKYAEWRRIQRLPKL